MFYRRKVILALLQLSNNKLDKLQLQKLLFLYNMIKQNPEYDFVPYKFGCYSYSAQADLFAMAKKSLVEENETQYIKTDDVNYVSQLKTPDRLKLEQIISNFGGMSSNELIKYTYTKYPLYAINSTIADKKLNAAEFANVEKAKPNQNQKTLFTIGYEGISLERYLMKLIENNVKLLIDVRKNPQSMKFGFSKSRLERYCGNLNIEYLHIPEVGIVSEQRQTLNTQKDYDRLFAQYRKTTLKEAFQYQEKIADLLDNYGRVALTCFEAEPCQCHRTHLAQAIEKLPNFKSQVVHL